MTQHGRLRSQGDFPNKRTVGYATILADLAHWLLPANLKNPHYDDEDVVVGLYVSPTGRLTFNTLYLDALRWRNGLQPTSIVSFQREITQVGMP